MVYNLPFHGHRLIEGWQISNIFGFHTGLPFTVVCGFDCIGINTQNSPNLPNMAAGVDYHKVTQPGNINRYFDTSAFALAPLGTIGNEGRNQFFGPSLANDDVAVVKNTRITESVNLQIRAEAFNIANHINPAVSDPNSSTVSTAFFAINSPTFGRFLAAYDPRILQFALKYVF